MHLQIQNRALFRKKCTYFFPILFLGNHATSEFSLLELVRVNTTSRAYFSNYAHFIRFYITAKQIAHIGTMSTSPRNFVKYFRAFMEGGRREGRDSLVSRRFQIQRIIKNLYSRDTRGLNIKLRLRIYKRKKRTRH